MRSWSKTASLLLALIPVAMLVFVVGDLFKEALPAMKTPGLKEMLTGRDFAGAYTTSRGVYGLVPAMWGTLLIVIVAVGIALPAALAVAVGEALSPAVLIIAPVGSTTYQTLPTACPLVSPAALSGAK